MRFAQLAYFACFKFLFFINICFAGENSSGRKYDEAKTGVFCHAVTLRKHSVVVFSSSSKVGDDSRDFYISQSSFNANSEKLSKNIETVGVKIPSEIPAENTYAFHITENGLACVLCEAGGSADSKRAALLQFTPDFQHAGEKSVPDICFWDFKEEIAGGRTDLGPMPGPMDLNLDNGKWTRKLCKSANGRFCLRSRGGYFEVFDLEGKIVCETGFFPQAVRIRFNLSEAVWLSDDGRSLFVVSKVEEAKGDSKYIHNEEIVNIDLAGESFERIGLQPGARIGFGPAAYYSFKNSSIQRISRLLNEKRAVIRELEIATGASTEYKTIQVGSEAIVKGEFFLFDRELFLISYPAVGASLADMFGAIVKYRLDRAK